MTYSYLNVRDYGDPRVRTAVISAGLLMIEHVAAYEGEDFSRMELMNVAFAASYVEASKLLSDRDEILESHGGMLNTKINCAIAIQNCINDMTYPLTETLKGSKSVQGIAEIRRIWRENN